MLIIGLCGLTATGKTYAGEFYQSKYKIKRVRISKYIVQYINLHFPNMPFEEFIDVLFNSHNALSEYIINDICNRIIEDNRSSKIITIDCLLHPQFGEVLKKINKDTYFIFFSSQLHQRIKRDMVKNKTDYKVAMEHIANSDILKIKHSAHDYEKKCDYNIDNNMSLKYLDNKLNTLLYELVQNCSTIK